MAGDAYWAIDDQDAMFIDTLLVEVWDATPLGTDARLGVVRIPMQLALDHGPDVNAVLYSERSAHATWSPHEEADAGGAGVVEDSHSLPSHAGSTTSSLNSFTMMGGSIDNLGHGLPQRHPSHHGHDAGNELFARLQDRSKEGSSAAHVTWRWFQDLPLKFRLGTGLLVLCFLWIMPALMVNTFWYGANSIWCCCWQPCKLARTVPRCSRSTLPPV